MKKKIMLGLMAMGAMSAVATAAAINPSNPAASNTVIFESTQVGEIVVNGKLKSGVAPVKYAVFATTDDGVANREDLLQLTDLILSQDEGTNVFEGTNPKVMVKKIDGGNNIINLSGENIEFKLKRDAAYTTHYPGTAGVDINNWIPAAEKAGVPATSLLPQTELQVIIDELNALNQGRYIIREFGMIENTTLSQIYKPANVVYFNHVANGELKITVAKDTNRAKEMNAAESAKVESKFFAGRNIGNVSILAKIKG